MMRNRTIGKKHRYCRGEGGFTIVELLIAMTLFSVGLLSVSTMQVSAIIGNQVGKQRTQATQLAQLQIEDLRNGDITTASYNIGTYFEPNNPIDELGANGGIFTRSWTISDNSNFSKRVIVKVDWRRMGNPHSISLSTIIKGGGI